MSDHSPGADGPAEALQGAAPEPPGSPGGPAAAVTQRTGTFEPPSVRAEQQRRSFRLLLLAVRLIFLALLTTVTVLTVASESEGLEFERTTILGLFIASVGVGLVVIIVDTVTPNKRLSSVVGVYLGVCVGLIGALAIGSLIDVVGKAWDLNTGREGIYLGLAKVIIAIVLCYLSVSVVLTTKDDFRLVIPYVEFAKQVRGVRPLALDTSALIDGRIESLGDTGFLDAPLVVPQFVLDELQALADSGDKLKRARGRRGLTLVSKLQGHPYVDISIDNTEIEGRAVDRMILQLAKEQNLRILTTDYNLNKVAQIHGVTVLNINDLANTLKPQVIPGEHLEVEIVKPGEGPGQGVGYLPDGTMVVVEEAAGQVGQLVSLIVTNSLQTSAGRMIFGRMAGPEEGHGGGNERVSERMAEAATSQPRFTARPGRAEESRSPRNPRR